MLEKEWDVLIVLDACRYDAFTQAESNIVGELNTIDSGASCTAEWYKTHWSKENDVTLVSANPIPFTAQSDYAHENFKKSIRAWRGSEISPEYTLSLASGVEGRVLVHLVPPHLPFIGEEGVAFLQRWGTGREGRRGMTVYNKVQAYGERGRWDELWSYYIGSIEEALRIIATALPNMKGKKVVITSDHGELIGKEGRYDHPCGRDDDELRRVPWLEVDIEESIMRRRLKELGYV